MGFTDQERLKIQKRIIKLLPQEKLHIGNVLAKVKISRNTLRNWLNEEEDFREQYEECFEKQKDEAEGVLYRMWQGIPDYDETGKQIGWIVKPSLSALQTFLQAKAGERGYQKDLGKELAKDIVAEFGDQELLKAIQQDLDDLEDDEWDTSQDDD